MPKLIDLIHLCGVSLSDFKIHCATGNKDDYPLPAFFDGQFKKWQEGQNQKNFQCNQILSLIHLHDDLWLFAGVYTVHDVSSQRIDGKPPFRYRTSEVKGLDSLTGRAVVQFEKEFRASYLRGEKYADKILLKELLGQRLSAEDLARYNQVLPHQGRRKTTVRGINPSPIVPIEKTYADFGDAPNDDPKELQLFAARVRRGQPAFRANLIRAYGARCALSNHGPSEVLEAVHIVAHAGSGINELNNGSLMRADLHYLFDAGLIRINPESLKLVVDVSLQDTPYWALKGKKIRPREDGKQPSTKYLIQRWKSDDPPRKG